MRHIMLGLMICGLWGAASAQTLSLSEAVEQAISNRSELRVQALQMQLAASPYEKTRAQWRPQISGTVDLRWNTQLQTSVLPIGSFGLPNTPADATTEIQLGLPFNNTIGVQADQKIYDPLRRSDRQITDAQLSRERTELERLTNDIRYAVTEAYYAALYKREQLSLAKAKVAQRQLDLEVAETQVQAGASLQNDYDRFALDFNNARYALRKVEQDYRLSLERLYYLIGSEAPAELQLTESLQGFLTDTLAVENRIAQRPELRLEQIDQTIYGLSQQRELYRLRPTVSAYANYTLLQLNDQFNPFESGTWFPFNFLGIKANIPIYDGQKARLEAQDYQVRQRISALRQERLAADFAFEARTQRNALEQARIDLVESQQNVALARQIFDTDRLRYEQGVIQQNDLINSEFSLKSAEENYLSAVYSLLLAHLNYQKAMGF